MILHKYSKTYKFTDINYAVASREDKEAMFLEYSELLNSLDSGDVYKRQAFTTVCVDIGGTAVPPAAKVVTGKVLDAADASGSDHSPVSYTHLDVYKRQG